MLGLVMAIVMAFENACTQACSTQKSVLLVPPGRTYLVNAMRFSGACVGKLIIQIDGTIVAPDEPKNSDPKSPRNWLSFSNLTGVTFQENGVIDGSGQKWWAASCKKESLFDWGWAVRVYANSYHEAKLYQHEEKSW
ncbi:probable polygalacturonase, partial [Tanacetum coccineum]